MKNKFIILILISLILNNCVGVSSTGIFGTGVSVAIDPRSLGTQIDDSIMQKIPVDDTPTQLFKIKPINIKIINLFFIF